MTPFEIIVLISLGFLVMAARCWCDKETESIPMDAVLAKAFAKRIETIMKVIYLADKAHWFDSPYAEIEALVKNFESGTI